MALQGFTDARRDRLATQLRWFGVQISEGYAGGAGYLHDGFLVEAFAVEAADFVDFGVDGFGGGVQDHQDFAGFAIDVAGSVAPLAGTVKDGEAGGKTRGHDVLDELLPFLLGHR